MVDRVGFEPTDNCLQSSQEPLAQSQPIYYIMVRAERLELSHLAALEPKSSASTNSAMLALTNLV